ncbi:MAG: hypothetical protein ACOC5T_09225, partial [Elusimicrobiota bacterium]
VLEKSFPDEDEEDRKKFGLKYMNTIIQKIFEMNLQQPDKTKKEVIEKVKNAKKEKSKGTE